MILHSRIKVMHLRKISLGSTQKSKSRYPTMQNLSENKMEGVKHGNKALGRRK